MGQDKAWKQVRTEWRDVVLVCRKCAKKLDGGFGPDGDQRFAKALRHALDDRGRKLPKMRRRAAAVLEVGCLDICPKKAIVVVRGSDPDRIVLVPERAGMAEIMERLGLDGGPGSRETDPVRRSHRGPDGGEAGRAASVQLPSGCR